MSQFYKDAILVPPQDWPWRQYFSPMEFADRSDGSVMVQPIFMERLYAARVILKEPMIITRGYSSREHNKNVGGVRDSSHEKGLGVDIRCHDSKYRLKLIGSLLDVEFTRIGIYDKHIHVDNDPELPPNVMWVGLSK